MRLTQAQVAQRSGIQQRQVSVIERGGDVMLSTLKKLAQALDLELRLVPREDIPRLDAILDTVQPPAALAAEESLLERYRVDDEESSGA